MHLQILVVPTETQDEINQNSSIDEILAHPDTIKYDLGRYFEDQNNDDLGLHWSILVDMDTKQNLTGFYNTEIFINHE